MEDDDHVQYNEDYARDIEDWQNFNMRQDDGHGRNYESSSNFTTSNEANETPHQENRHQTRDNRAYQIHRGSGNRGRRERKRRTKNPSPRRAGASRRSRSSSSGASGQVSGFRVRMPVRNTRQRAQPRAQPRGEAIGRDDMEEADYAELLDNEAKMAKIYQFKGQELLQLGRTPGQDLSDEQEEEQQRHIAEMLKSMPQILADIRSGDVDTLALFREKLQGNVTKCKLCQITQLDPLDVNKMNALMACNLVETSMIGLVNPQQLATNKTDIFNMYQVGLAAKGGKCDVFVTEAEVLRHNTCGNNPLFIQNEIVTLIRTIIDKLQGQLVGTIETPTGPMPYTNIKRIGTLISLTRELNKALVTFQTSKRLILNSLNRGDSVTDAFSMIGGVSTGRKADGIQKKQITEQAVLGRGNDAVTGNKTDNTANRNANNKSKSKGFSRISFGTVDTKAGSYVVV